MVLEEIPLNRLSGAQLLIQLGNVCSGYNAKPSYNSEKQRDTSNYIPSDYYASGNSGGSHNRVPGP